MTQEENKIHPVRGSKQCECKSKTNSKLENKIHDRETCEPSHIVLLFFDAVYTARPLLFPV
jgi:hypothetical protein